MNKTLFSNQQHFFELARRDGLRLPGSLPENVSTWIDRLYPLLAILFCLVTPFVSSLFALIPFLFFMVLESGSSGNSINQDIQLVTQLISGFLPMYFIVWLWAWIVEKRQLWTLGLEKKRAIVKFLKGGLAGLILFSAPVGLIGLFGYLRVDLQAIIPTVPVLGSVVLLLVGWIVQGSAEELLTRGYLLPVVGSRYGAPAGIILSSVVFAGLHLLNPNVSWLAVSNLVLFGVFASLYTLHEGGIWGICALHAVWNWVQGNVFGFEVSGGALAASSLFNFQETGPDWFTGGNFGPEGGLAVTLVLVVGCLWLVVAGARSSTAS